MKFKEFYLNEMIIQGDKPEDGDYVVAFDKWIWAINDDTSENVMNDIIKKVGLSIGDVDTSDAYSFISELQDQKNDILAGQINGDDLYLYDYGSFKLDPKSSILVKKVVNQLGLGSSSYIEDTDSTQTNVSKWEMEGKIPDVAYHGTTTKYLNGIMSKGIRPSQAGSNYARQGIYHPNLIFFSTRIGEAMHHAQHTASQQGGDPVIIAFKIKDKDKIVPDYDVESLTGKSSFYDFGDIGSMFGKAYNKKGGSLSREFGVYGYKGNILPMHFTEMYVAPSTDVYSIDEFEEVDPKDVKKIIDNVGEFNHEYIGYEDFEDEDE